MSKNVDWAQFGISAQTQRRIIASLCEVLDCGYGSVEIKVQDHKIKDVVDTKRRRMDLREKPRADIGDG